jgi:NAD(P)-dependent dehydrogenase (short-subunit alcohol dehydrogenase family)
MEATSKEKNMKLEGKTALVAGGGSGIGQATAITLAHEGAKVAIADIVRKNAEKVRDEIKGNGSWPSILNRCSTPLRPSCLT